MPAVEVAPLPVFGAANQIGFQSVPLHIPADCIEVFIVLNRKRFETALINMAGTGTVAMGVHR